MRGFEPRTFRMQSGRSTTELHPQLSLARKNLNSHIKTSYAVSMSSIFQNEIVKFVIHKITISVYINDICVLKKLTTI